MLGFASALPNLPGCSTFEEYVKKDKEHLNNNEGSFVGWALPTISCNKIPPKRKKGAFAPPFFFI